MIITSNGLSSDQESFEVVLESYNTLSDVQSALKTDIIIVTIGNDFNIEIIILVVVGVILMLSLLVFIILFLKRKIKRRN